MPRIPRPSAVGLPAIRPPSPSVERDIRHAWNVAGESISQALEVYNENSRKSEFVALSGEIDRGLLDLRLEIEQDPSLDTAKKASEAYLERSKPIVEEALSRSQWKVVHTAVSARAAESVTTNAAAASRIGYRREIDASKAAVSRNIDTAVERYSLSDDETERIGILARVRSDLAMEPHLSEQEKEVALTSMETDAARQRTIRLINEDRFDAATEFLKSDEAASVLDPDDVYRLTSSIELRRRAAETARKKALKVGKDSIKQDILPRIFGYGDQINLAEIFALPLDAKEKEHYAKLLQDQTTGKRMNVDDPFVVKGLLDKIDRGLITDPIELHGRLLHGLSFETERILKNRIEERAKPENASIQKLIDEHFKAAERDIYRGSPFKNDPLTAGKYNEYYFDKTSQLDEMRANGATNEQIREVLDPKSKDYIGRDMENYLPTLAESQAALTGRLHVPTPAEKAPPETTKEYTKEDGIETGEIWNGKPVYLLPDGRTVTFND